MTYPELRRAWDLLVVLTVARIREELEVPGPHPPEVAAEAAEAARRTLGGLEAAVGTGVEAAIIGEGSVIVDSDISDAVIGVRSYIAAATRIRRAVLLGSDYYPWQDGSERSPVGGPARPGIGEGTVIEGAIVDRNASVGRACTITNQQGIQDGEGPGFYIRDGIIVILKNAEIADGTVI